MVSSASRGWEMLHLLLIEDNPADVMMIREALRGSHSGRRGYSV
jgi:CheY-like chemotaxis protein